MSTRDDFREEIDAHLALEADRLVDEGMGAEEARLAARRRFGNVTAVHERFYESQRWMWLDHLRQDFRAGRRAIARYPVAAAVAILSLGFGIGATTATLTIRDVVFRKPPVLYNRPEDLSIVRVGRADRPLFDRYAASTPAALYAMWREDPKLQGAIAAATPGRLRDVRTEDRTDALQIRAVTPEFFNVFGVSAAIGVAKPSPGAAILSDRVWQTLFDRRTDVVGQVVWIENRPYTVAGVMPPRFWFTRMNSPIWIPLDPDVLQSEQMVQVVARRPQGMTREGLEARLQKALMDYTSRLPAADRQLRVNAWGVEGTPIGNDVSLVLPYVLAVSVLLTLLIAIANVAILMIAQWTAREHEIAIRASLGAGRWRIVQALVTESLLIAVCGGALGVAMTFALRGVVLHRVSVDVAFFDLSIDPAVWIQTAIVTVLSGILIGLAPALLETRRLHGNPLTAISSSERVRQRWRHALVVVEITVTVALLVEASAMIDGYRRQLSAELGFATRPLLTARVEHPGGVPQARIVEMLRQVPGVRSAAAATVVPLATSFGPLQPVATDAAGSHAASAEQNRVGAEFFETLGVPLRAGRPFTRQDSASVMVNETLATQLFGSRDVVGRTVWIGGQPYDVVGVVANYSNNPFQNRRFEAKVFLPLPPKPADLTQLQFIVHAAADPVPLVQTVRRAIRDLPNGGVVTRGFTLDQVIEVAGQEMLIGTAPLVPLIAVGLLLTMAGIYGVLAFAITRRSRELAVRVAIGATGRDLARLVAAYSLRLVSVGIVLGLAVMAALTKVVQAGGGAGSLFDASWRAFAVPVVTLLAIASLATWLPSRRATQINPAVLLRSL